VVGRRGGAGRGAVVRHGSAARKAWLTVRVELRLMGSTKEKRKVKAAGYGWPAGAAGRSVWPGRCLAAQGRARAGGGRSVAV
jgi:hypothetical protein